MGVVNARYIVKGQGQIFGAVKGSSMEICWVKILTPVTGGSTGAYIVSPPCIMISV